MNKNNNSQLATFKENLEKMGRIEKLVTSSAQTLAAEDVAFVISRWTKIPVSKMVED